MRLDISLVQKGYFDSRTKAKQAIERREVKVNNKVVVKSSFEINKNDCIEIVQPVSFVSIGGYKLYKALNEFNFSVKNLICADLGASTGGFTDCLLQNGCKKVYAVDLNDTLLHKTLKNNDKVVEIIKNVKNLTTDDFTDKINFVCADLSFISEKIVLPIIYSLIEDNEYAIILIKPQFEAGKRRHFKNGIIRDEKLILSICRNIYDFAISIGLIPLNITKAPNSDDKNTELLMLLQKNNGVAFDMNIFEL